MIRFALSCDEDHTFESWFRSGEDYEAQNRRGLVACPFCGSTRIGKSVMAPRVARSDRAPAARMASGLPDEMLAKLREIRAFVEANAESVGAAFPEEARRIHYGEAPARAIYGEASPEDVRALAEEGVEIAPVPRLPEDRN